MNEIDDVLADLFSLCNEVPGFVDIFDRLDELIDEQVPTEGQRIVDEITYRRDGVSPHTIGREIVKRARDEMHAQKLVEEAEAYLRKMGRPTVVTLLP